MKCDIVWNKLTVEEWENRFNKIDKSTISQSYHYARAMCKTNHQRARWGLILIDDREAGLVQIIEAGFLFGFIHAVILDRGPLWFDGYGGVAHISSFFKTFNEEFPRRWRRKRRIIPEINNGVAIAKVLMQCGLQRLEANQNYQTLWWDLNLDDDTARSSLKNNWRGSLQKAEKANLDVHWDRKGKFYPWLRDIYIKDKQNRGFNGISPKLMDNLALFSTPDNPIMIGKVSIEGRDIAAVLFICHGRTATYQIGWSSKEGRKYCAHHFLLWQARSMLPSLGIRYLDLGGMNDETAQGVKKFKEGTGAHPSILAGHYS